MRGPILERREGHEPVTAKAIGAPTHAWHASRGRDLERTVRSAGRHSRLVRVVRVALPVAVVLGLGAYAGITYFNPMDALSALPSVSGKLGIQGSKITMEAPRIAGISRSQRAYQLTAETAVQDITKPDQIEMQNLRAEMELGEGDIMVVTAKSGTYSSKADKVTLRDHVVFTTAQGYNAKMQQADIDMKKGSLRTDRPVDVKMPAGRIIANGAEMENGGELLRFTHGVVFHMNAAEAEAGK
jgi:lipopolysaccharide export system protein LptC